jgi:hypothetical protein
VRQTETWGNDIGNMEPSRPCDWLQHLVVRDSSARLPLRRHVTGNGTVESASGAFVLCDPVGNAIHPTCRACHCAAGNCTALIPAPGRAQTPTSKNTRTTVRLATLDKPTRYHTVGLPSTGGSTPLFPVLQPLYPGSKKFCLICSYPFLTDQGRGEEGDAVPDPKTRMQGGGPRG